MKKITIWLFQFFLSKPVLKRLVFGLQNNPIGGKFIKKLKSIYLSEVKTESDAEYLDPQSFEIYLELKKNIVKGS